MRFFIVIFCLYTLSSHADEADKILGEWLTQNKQARFLIYKTDKTYAGKISWLKKPNDEKGNLILDENNPNPELRTQPLLGAVLLHHLVYLGKNKWGQGRIYNPQDGNEYKCTLTFQGDILKVRGYLGIPLLGKTETWTRFFSNSETSIR